MNTSKTIIWSTLAEEDLENLIDYLEENWNEKVILDFLDKLEEDLFKIALSPDSFPVINHKLLLMR